MEDRKVQFDAALQRLASDVASTLAMESALAGKGAIQTPKSRSRARKTTPANECVSVDPKPRDPFAILDEVLIACKRKRQEATKGHEETPSPELVDQMACFTDKFKLSPYQNFMHYVPRLVNVVTLAEAIPVPGSGAKLPLDLHRIAARCRNSYYAPKKFSAVQLAYSEPRCRVLVFHTGRLVGTGTSGPMAARLALLRAQRQLYQDAGVHIHLRNFSVRYNASPSSLHFPVINQVGAFSLRATLNCEAFATEHSSTAHFDVKSFVGLAWRPAGESICCEVYGTGRANLPGSVVERQLQDSLSRMFPELLRFSSSSHLLSKVPEDLQQAHRPAAGPSEPAPQMYVPPRLRRYQQKRAASPQNPAASKPVDIWDGWGEGANTSPNRESASLDAFIDDESESGEFDLGEMGL